MLKSKIARQREVERTRESVSVCPASVETSALEAEISALCLSESCACGCATRNPIKPTPIKSYKITSVDRGWDAVERGVHARASTPQHLCCLQLSHVCGLSAHRTQTLTAQLTRDGHAVTEPSKATLSVSHTHRVLFHPTLFWPAPVAVGSTPTTHVNANGPNILHATDQ